MGFEGVEKRLIVELSSGCPGSEFKPLDLTPDDWKPILEASQCEILSHREIDGQKIYLLSESTLAVWDSGFLLKTCGKTSPLKGLSRLIETYPSVIKQTVWLAYTRAEFAHPDEQLWPHQSFDQEVSFIQQIFPQVQHRTLPAGNQKFHIVFHSSSEILKAPIREFEEVLLFGIDEQCVDKITSCNEPPSTNDKGAENSGSTLLLLGKPLGEGVLDEFWFKPQGYSCNAAAQSQFFSCHISPEPETSYASLERGLLEPTPSSIFSPEQFVTSFQPKCAHHTYLKVAPTAICPKASTSPPDRTGLVCTVTHETGMGENRHGVTITLKDTAAT